MSCRFKCFVVSVSWSENKKFQKVFKHRIYAENFFNYVKEEIKVNFLNSKFLDVNKKDQDWYFAPKEEKDVFVSLRCEFYASSDKAIKEYEDWTLQKTQD